MPEKLPARIPLIFMILGMLISVLGFPNSTAFAAQRPVPGGPCKKSDATTTYRQYKLRCTVGQETRTWQISRELTAPQISINNLDSFWTPIIARRNVTAAMNRIPHGKSAVDLSVAPNVDSSQVSEELRLLGRAERLFAGYFSPTRYDLVLFSELDGDWADQKMKELGASLPYTASTEISRSSRGNCNFAFATIGMSGGFFGQCMDTAGRTLRDRQTVIHEYFHLVQFQYSTAEPMPCWLMEGGATFFGAALGVDEADQTGETSLAFLRDLMNQFNPDGKKLRGSRSDLIAALSSPDDPLRVFRNLNTRPNENQNCVSLAAYSIGALLTEVLIATHGSEKFMQFVTSFSDRSPWKHDFRRIFEMDLDDFYIAARPYVLAKAQ